MRTTPSYKFIATLFIDFDFHISTQRNMKNKIFDKISPHVTIPKLSTLWVLALFLLHAISMNCLNNNNCIPEPVPLYTGFVGHNVKLLCKSFQPETNESIAEVKWYFKCPSCGIDWSPVANLSNFQSKRLLWHYNFSFMGGTAYISQFPGTLSVLNFQAVAEGLYMCTSTGRKPKVMELKSAGEFTV